MEKYLNITKEETNKIITEALNTEDDQGWLIKIQAGRNLYDKVLNPDDLVISSIVARGILKNDLLCFIFAFKETDLEETCQLYNEIVDMAKVKVSIKKEAIKGDFLNQIAGKNDISI